MAYGQINADVIGTSTAGSNLGAGNASIMKNRLINGAMVISQRNGTSSVTPTADNTYTLDRWSARLSAASKFSVVQSSTAPAGFSNSLLITSLAATSLAAGDFYNIIQAIEGYNVADLGWGTANAKTITLSFQVQSSLTGTFGGSLINAGGYSYPFTYSIPVANTWTTISVTVAGPTAGTWATGNTAGLQVWFGLGVGSTYSGTAGSWAATNYFSATGATSVVGTNGATFYITGVQLEVGSSATGFEYVNYQTSLANCQRYLPCFNANNTFSGAAPTGNGFASTATSATFLYKFPVSTRVPPTGISVSANADFTVNLAGSGQAGTITFAYASTDVASLNISQTGRTAGQGGYFYGNVSTAQIQFTGCEL